MEVEKHIRFLNFLVGIDKALRVFVIAKKFDNSDFKFEKLYT